MPAHTRSRHMPMLWLALFLAILALPAAPGAAHQGEVEVVIGTTDFPRTLDPADTTDYPSWELLTHLYTGLARQIPGSLRYELALASDHRVSEDGLTHTFIVRPDATFADGTPITASTFVRSIRRVMALGRDAADLLNRYIVEVSEGEGNAVRFTLSIPLPDFEAFVALPPFFPLHPEVYPAEALLDEEASQTIIGNGPYRLESFRPGREAVLTPNPAYDGPAPANNRLVLRRYSLPIDLRLALLAREIHVAWRALALPDLDVVAQEPGILIRQQPNLQVYYLLFNHDREPFDDPAVRQAFALLVDRELSAGRGFDNTVTPLYSLLPPQLGSTAVPFPTYDLEQAEAVLMEAGYRPRRRTVRVPLYISTETYGDLMADAAQELRRGIEESEMIDISAINNDQTGAFTRAVYRGEYIDAIIGWRPPLASPAGYLIPLAHSSQRIPGNGHYGSPQIDDLLRTAAQTTDAGQRDALYQEVQTLLLNDYALVPLWQGQDVIAFWADVSGVIVEANSWLRYDALALP